MLHSALDRTLIDVATNTRVLEWSEAGPNDSWRLAKTVLHGGRQEGADPEGDRHRRRDPALRHAATADHRDLDTSRITDSDHPGPHSEPGRIARNGALFSRDGRINIVSAPHRRRDEPLEEGCDCYTCQTFSAAYVHHMFKAGELLAYRLATIHNLRFVLRLMEEMREAVANAEFDDYRTAFHARFVPPDQRARHEQKTKWLQSQGRPGA